MLEAYSSKVELYSGHYTPGHGKEFELCERGRRRPIRAPTVRDRMIQKTMN